MVYAVAKLIVIPFYKLWLKSVKGIENLPKDKAFIVALNHSSYYDTILPYAIILPKLDKQMHALVNSSYWKILPAKVILDWGSCIPVYVGEDSNPKKNELALKKAKEFLEKGHILQIFPEGKRNADGKLTKGHVGIAKLAVLSRVPVVPMGLIDTHKVLPKGKLFPKFKRCEVKIGKPIYFDEYYGKKPSTRDFENITRRIMKEIAKLIGQKYNY